jgi:hypothetical protein
MIPLYPRLVRLSAAAVLVLAAAGCLQVETRVKVNEDGSATITERVRFSRRLLDLARMRKGGADLESYLGKAHVLGRVGQMGDGAKLVSHEIRNAEGGARECVSVIQIPDLNNLRYVSPFLDHYRYPKHTVLEFSLTPCYKSPHYGLWPGEMAVRVSPATSERAPRRPEGQEAPPPTTPAEHQVFRDLRPIFRDMLQGFKLRLVVESYAPIGMARGYYYYRGQRSATREYDLIDFSAEDLDRFGYDFLTNEEIMLELLRFQMAGDDLMATVKQHPNNPNVPVYHTHGIPPITFRPSRALFDRHFKGKQLMFDERRGGPRMADYDEIGLQERVRENGATEENGRGR